VTQKSGIEQKISKKIALQEYVFDFLFAAFFFIAVLILILNYTAMGFNELARAKNRGWSKKLAKKNVLCCSKNGIGCV